MMFRTLIYAVLFYGVFWLVRRFLGGMFGAPRGGAASSQRKRKRFDGQAVDADFEELDDNAREKRPHD